MTWRRLRFSATLRYALLGAAATGLYAALALAAEGLARQGVLDLPVGVEAVLSAAFGIFLVVRFNRAYDRCSEARRLWGQLVNACRNLAVKSAALVRPVPEESQELLRLLTGFCTALKDHLRGDASLRGIPGFEREKESPRHVPGYLAGRVYRLLRTWVADGRLTPQAFLALDLEARALLDVCGGCERIRNTLIAASFRPLTLQVIVLYLLVLPWGLIDTSRYWTVPITAVAAYLILALERIAEELDHPFDYGADRLDLERFCAAVESSVSEILGWPQAAPPDPPRPDEAAR